MTKWLDAEQGTAWRSYIRGSLRLFSQLERELQRECGLSLAEFEVLVHLSEAADRRLRMSKLADLVVSSKSRLTHLVNRMETRGNVRREECVTDRRGSFAVLAEPGWELLQRAAPIHLRGVREYLVDAIDDADLRAMGVTCAVIDENLPPER